MTHNCKLVLKPATRVRITKKIKVKIANSKVLSQTFLKNPQTFQSVFSQIDSPLSTLQECTTLKFFGSALFGAATGAFSVAYAIGGNKGIPLEEYGIFNFGSDSATEREIFLLGFRISEKS